MLRKRAIACVLLAMCCVAAASSVWPSGTSEGPDAAVRAQTLTTSPISRTCFASRSVTTVTQVNAGGMCPPEVPGLQIGEPCTTPSYCDDNSTDRLCPAKEYKRFSVEGVQAHFTQQPPGFPMTDVKRTTFSCVDARGDEPMLGTPGGDLSEIMNAAMALHKLLNTQYSQALTDEVFDAFAANVASAQRPLYFHTDDSSLRRMFTWLRENGLPNQPTVMPFRGPTSATAQNLWLQALVMPQHNGCGHIRLQLDPETAPYYSIRRNDPIGTRALNCVNWSGPCISSTPIAQRIITRFFQYWWFTNTGSIERQRVSFAVDGILVGPLLGKAVAIINNAPARGVSQHTCADHAPMVRPLFGGSKVFVYHGSAVPVWRDHVARGGANQGISALLAKYNIRNTEPANQRHLTIKNFITTWNAISTQQLTATLTWLRPANSIGIFNVNIPVGASSTLQSQSVNAAADEPQAEVAVVASEVAAAATVVPDVPQVIDAAGVAPVGFEAVVTEAGR